MEINVHTQVVVFWAIFGYVYGEDVRVQTPVGEIIGSTTKVTKGGRQYEASQFLGIPFAEAPVGERRFSKPVKKETYSSPIMAKVPGPQCPSLYEPGDEDCLNLNIFVSGKKPFPQSRPVMIWIYGGGFQVGSQDVYMSPEFAAMNDVIYVTFNYRVGAFGFLANRNYDLKGNYGLWDQHMAIQWVHDNIAAFGGDTNRVTIFGESAGAASVIYQCLYPGNAGLFQNAIAQSGTSRCEWAFDKTPEKEFFDFVDGANCSVRPSDIKRCIRELNADSVLQVAGETLFNPTVDGEFVQVSMDILFKSKDALPKSIMKHFGEINLIIGVNDNDGTDSVTPDMENGTSIPYLKTIFPSIFDNARLPAKDIVIEAVLHEYFDMRHIDDPIYVANKYTEFIKDKLFLVPMIETADAHVNAGGTGSCYMYEFSHERSFVNYFSYGFEWMRGAKHTDEIPFILGIPKGLLFTNVSDTFTMITEEERQLTRRLMTMWTQFATSGSPNSDEKIEWPLYDTNAQQYIELKGNGSEFPVWEKLGLNAVNFWDNLIPMLVQLVEDEENCRIGLSSAARSIAPLAAFCILLPVLFNLL